MSVYIKGFPLPNNCGACPLRLAWCRERIYMVTRPKRCPLVPVPPHGIIDREQILDSIRLELAQANAVNDMEDYDSWMRVFDYVRKFPTMCGLDIPIFDCNGFCSEGERKDDE